MKRAGYKKIILVAGIWVTFLIPAVSLAQGVASSPQDPLAGSRVFGRKGCSGCHSVNGVGGKSGPDLGQLGKQRTFYDLASAMWNHIPEMVAKLRKAGTPPAQLSARDTGDLIAFLSTVNYFDPRGDSKAGKQVFSDKKCVLCHQVEGVGGVFGPSLDSVVQFGPIFFAAAMWNHGPSMAAAMQARGIKRPVFSGKELRDLIAYVKSVSSVREDRPIQILPGPPAEGERLFASKGCVDCHGIKGMGGPVGPKLAGRKLFPSLFEFAAAMWNKGPVMMREMKRRVVEVPPLGANELAAIVGYLYSLDYFAGPGDPHRGEAVVHAKGCLGCHSAHGKGGGSGPAFEKVHGLTQPANIVSAMWNHGAVMESKMRTEAMSWPVLTGEEMSQVVGYLESLGRSR